MRTEVLGEKRMQAIVEESLFIPLNETDTLHLKRFCGDPQGAPVFMLHGSIENGRIFYSQNGKGLAPFLAQRGFDVFVADIRGRGLSTPPVSRQSKYGVTECIREEIPAFLDEIKRIRGNAPLHWIGHSWGSILLLCHYARSGAREKIRSMIFFGSKRRITIGGLRKFIMIDFVYNYIFGLMVWFRGFVDVKFLNVGSDNETKKSRRQTYDWVTNTNWRDEDGFDYAMSLRGIQLPPLLFVAGGNDKVLGNYTDMKLFMEEINHPEAELYFAGISHGNLHNYDHVNMLTHADAPRDHFQYVVNWMKKYS